MVGGKEKLISPMITGLHLAELRTYIGLEVAALTCYRAEKNAHLHFCETLSFSKGDLLPVLSLVMEHVVTVREGASLNILFNQTSRKVCIGYPPSANLSREPDMDSLFEKGTKSKSFTHRPVHLPGLHHITPAAIQNNLFAHLYY